MRRQCPCESFSINFKWYLPKKFIEVLKKGRRHLVHNNFSEFMNLTLQGKFSTAAESVKSCGLSPIGCM